jgi:hypothetical protein
VQEDGATVVAVVVLCGWDDHVPSSDAAVPIAATGTADGASTFEDRAKPHAVARSVAPSNAHRCLMECVMVVSGSLHPPITGS